MWVWVSEGESEMGGQGSIQWGGGGGGEASTPKKFQLQSKILWNRPYLSVKIYLE